MSLLVVGTVAFDDIETPFGKAGKIVGGAATYICYSAAFFSRDIKLVSVIGDDFPMNEIKKLQIKGVNTEGLQIKQGEKSFYWSGCYHADLNSRDTLDTQLNVLATFDPIVPDAYKNSEFVMLGNLTPTLQLRVLDQLNTQPILVVLDTMNFWMSEEFINDLKKVLSRIDVLTINDEEARLLSGQHSLVKAAKIIHTLGPKFIIIKKGEHGALLFHDHQVFFAPALPLEEVFDPTGAGDTFAGGFIGHIAKTRDISFDNMKRAVIIGSAMASFCVEQFGIRCLESLNETQIEARVQQFIDLVQFDIELIA